MTTRQLNRLFHEAADGAGIKKGVTLHALRHSSGSRIIPATDVRCGYFLGDRTIWGVLMAA
jgi:integrase/recombinase XerD